MHITALALQVVLPLVFFYQTGGENPYKWMWEVRNPLIVAFSTESSVSLIAKLSALFELLATLSPSLSLLPLSLVKKSGVFTTKMPENDTSRQIKTD
jgi:Na+/H+-dicarboxylate symporter